MVDMLRQRNLRQPGDPFLVAQGVCLDASQKFGAQCECDTNGNSDSTAHVIVTCKSYQGTATMKEEVIRGGIVYEVICDKRPNAASQGLFCIQKNFKVDNVGRFSYRACDVTVGGRRCQSCSKRSNICQNGDEGFVTSCENVEPALGKEEALCLKRGGGGGPWEWREFESTPVPTQQPTPAPTHPPTFLPTTLSIDNTNITGSSADDGSVAVSSSRNLAQPQGIVIMGSAFVLFVAAIVWFCYERREDKKSRREVAELQDQMGVVNRDGKKRHAVASEDDDDTEKDSTASLDEEGNSDDSVLGCDRSSSARESFKDEISVGSSETTEKVDHCGIRKIPTSSFSSTSEEEESTQHETGEIENLISRESFDPEEGGGDDSYFEKDVFGDYSETEGGVGGNDSEHVEEVVEDCSDDDGEGGRGGGDHSYFEDDVYEDDEEEKRAIA